MKRPFLLAAALFLILTLRAGLPAAEPGSPGVVEGVESVGLSVSDLDRSVRFFCEVLTFEKVSEAEVAGEDYERLEGLFGLRLRTTRLRLGEEFLDLTECLAPRGRPVPADSRSNDRWFQHVAIIVRDMDRAYRRLRQHRVEHASSGPQRLPDWNPNAGGIKAFYFKDPDGHPLEVLEFPPDKGDPKWRRPRDSLFLGIDHTAIVVSDTGASVALYRRLGFRVAGQSENHGTEQEHLNNVFGARLRITALRAAAGPGIELLEYLSPPGGRPALADARINDLVATQTRLVVRGPAEEASAIISSARLPFVSPGVVSLPGSGLGFPRGFVVRDPDGHALLIVERENVERNSKP